MDVFLEALEFLYEEASFLAVSAFCIQDISRSIVAQLHMLNFQTSSSNVSTLASTLNDNASDMLIRRKRSRAVALPRPALVAGRGGGGFTTFIQIHLDHLGNHLVHNAHKMYNLIWGCPFHTFRFWKCFILVGRCSSHPCTHPRELRCSSHPCTHPREAEVHMPATADASCANGLTWAFESRRRRS